MFWQCCQPPLSAGFVTCHQVNITALGWGLSSIPRAQFPSLPHGHFTGLFSLDTMAVSDSAVSHASFSHLLPKPENLLLLHQNILRTGPLEKAMGTSAPCFVVSFKPMMDVIKSNYKRQCSSGLRRLLFPLIFSQLLDLGGSINTLE